MELERQRNILIIGHQAVLRCLYAYFMKIPLDELPYIKIPLHTVISITPRAHGCDEERYTLDIPAVDTHRDPRKSSKPNSTSVSASNSPAPQAASVPRVSPDPSALPSGLNVSKITVSSVCQDFYSPSPATPSAQSSSPLSDGVKVTLLEPVISQDPSSSIPQLQAEKVIGGEPMNV
jgi:hypothetical protein